MNHLRDIEIRLLFQVYVQSLGDSWGLRWGNLAETCHLGWQTSERLQTTDCLKSVGGSFCWNLSQTLEHHDICHKNIQKPWFLNRFETKKNWKPSMLKNPWFLERCVGHGQVGEVDHIPAVCLWNSNGMGHGFSIAWFRGNVTGNWLLPWKRWISVSGFCLLKTWLSVQPRLFGSALQKNWHCGSWLRHSRWTKLFFF